MVNWTLWRSHAKSTRSVPRRCRGQFLRPDTIKLARQQFAQGEITAQQLRAVEDEAIRHVVEQQCSCGLHIVTDGEFRRARWHFDFFDGLQGVERYDSEQGIQFNGVQTKAHAGSRDG